ncbi:MAG TPA: FAD:protein FMN transferase [Nevskiaceae bacterium]|nr:FAD:protein FMN transferase [Nevskiaceae bacterium]
MELLCHSFHAMGGPCEARVYGRDATHARAAAQAAQDEVLRLERKYTRYRDDSLTSAINRSAGDARGIEVDDETAALLDYADTAWQQSEGAFDITSGVLRRAWNFRSGKVPAQAQIDAILPLVGWPQVRWSRPRLVLPLAGMELDFGGYVKEYAADRAAQCARDAGCAHGFVELGGDIALIGPHPGGAPWQIGVRDPRARERALVSVALAQGALASSGDYERCMEIGGVRYAHILDPRSGWPVRGLTAVSVIAPQCLVAGTATTIAMLKGEDGLHWLEELGLRWMAVDAAGRLHGDIGAAAR